MRSLIIAAALAFASSSAVAVTCDEQPWYEDRPASVKTLKQAIVEEHRFLRYHYINDKKVEWPGGENPYWRGHPADVKTCGVLKSVGLTCDYNTRVTLTDFLAVNGKGLFPASGGTNPYYSAKDRAWDIQSYKRLGCHGLPIDNGYIGHGRQSAMLAAAVRRNANLFHHGDLSAADVRSKWR